MDKFNSLVDLLKTRGLYNKYQDYLKDEDVDARLEVLAEDIKDEDDVDYIVEVIQKMVERHDRKLQAKNKGMIFNTPLWFAGIADGSVEWWLNEDPSGVLKFETESMYTADDVARALRQLADIVGE